MVRSFQLVVGNGDRKWMRPILQTGTRDGEILKRVILGAQCAAHFIETLASIPFLKAPVLESGAKSAWYALIQVDAPDSSDRHP
jgi:hypothetical protein